MCTVLGCPRCSIHQTAHYYYQRREMEHWDCHMGTMIDRPAIQCRMVALFVLQPFHQMEDGWRVEGGTGRFKFGRFMIWSFNFCQASALLSKKRSIPLSVHLPTHNSTTNCFHACIIIHVLVLYAIYTLPIQCTTYVLIAWMAVSLLSLPYILQCVPECAFWSWCCHEMFS